jgi:hypothetical protein
LAATISASIRMTDRITTPAIMSLKMIAGPVAAIAALLLTNRPAPMIPPMAIIARRRERRVLGNSTGPVGSLSVSAAIGCRQP